MAARLCVLLFCCWSVVWARELSPDCKKGPSYWCHDLTSASQCGQLNYCRDNAWKGSNDFNCVLCEGTVAVLVEVAKNNESEEEAKRTLEDACRQIGGELGALCTNFVSNNFDAMWNYLQNGSDPYKICFEMGICTNETHKAPQVEGLLCIVCELVMKDLESMLVTNATAGEIEAALEKVCSLLPLTLESECKSFVTTYGPQIIKLVLNGTTPTLVCTILGLCFESNTAVLDTKPEVKEQGLLCLVCELAMKELDSLIFNNSTQAEIEAALKKVCSIFPSTLKTDCNNFVAKYGPEIIKLVVEGTSPKVICTLIGVCLLSESEPYINDCDICKVVVSVADAYLEDNATAPEVAKVLETVCDILPDTIKAECVVFVGNYTEELVSLLVQDLQPEEVCHTLKLCTSFVVLPHRIEN
eukprot:Em0010g821a